MCLIDYFFNLVNIPQHLSSIYKNCFHVSKRYDTYVSIPKEISDNNRDIAPRTLEGALSCDKICQMDIFLKRHSDILDMSPKICYQEYY